MRTVKTIATEVDEVHIALQSGMDCQLQCFTLTKYKARGFFFKATAPVPNVIRERAFSDVDEIAYSSNLVPVGTACVLSFCNQWGSKDARRLPPFI